MFNINFNSNLLIGVILIMVGVVWLYNFLKGRNDRFKGKIPLIISSVVVMIIGLILFISGWITALA